MGHHALDLEEDLEELVSSFTVASMLNIEYAVYSQHCIHLLQRR